MFGTIKSNLIILAVALVAMFAAVAADAQTVDITAGKYSVSSNGTRTITATAKVNKVTIKTTQTTKDEKSKNKTVISNSFSLFDKVVSGKASVTLNTNAANKIDSSLTIKKTIGGVALKASTYSLVGNSWNFSAAATVGEFDLKITETVNFDSGVESTKFNVGFDIPNSKYKIALTASDNGAFSFGFKK